MSAKTRVNETQREGTLLGSMSGQLPRVGAVTCYRTKERHRKWLWGIKKGRRRARRREDQVRIEEALESCHE